MVLIQYLKRLELQEAIKNRYLYQRFLLDEVVWQMLYRASDKLLEERVNFKNLDQYLKSELINNGIDTLSFCCY